MGSVTNCREYNFDVNDSMVLEAVKFTQGDSGPSRMDADV